MVKKLARRPPHAPLTAAAKAAKTKALRAQLNQLQMVVADLPIAVIHDGKFFVVQYAGDDDSVLLRNNFYPVSHYVQGYKEGYEEAMAVASEREEIREEPPQRAPDPEVSEGPMVEAPSDPGIPPDKDEAL